MKLAFELEVPDGAVDKRAEADLARSVKEQTVLKLYSEQRITTGEAAEMLGQTRIRVSRSAPQFRSGLPGGA